MGRLIWLMLAFAACGATSADVDVEALSARDILGLSPPLVADWDDESRDVARARIDAAARDCDGGARAVLGLHDDVATAVLASVAEIDFDRERAHRDVVPFGRVDVDGLWVDLTPVAAEPGVVFDIVEVGWSEDDGSRPERASLALSALAAAAGHPAGAPLFVSPARREPFAALYLPERRQLLLNPIYLLVLEDEPESETEPVIEPVLRSASHSVGRSAIAESSFASAARDGNPYSFFGSIGECAASERLRCEACVGTGSCVPSSRDENDGDTECQALAADNGRGYYLFCANLSLAITTIAECVAKSAPSCPINPDAGNLLSALEANAGLVDDATCLAATDACLEDAFGAPGETFPPPPNPMDPPPPPPPAPRNVDVSCGEGQANCDFSPQLGCSSESCGSCEGGSCSGGSCEGSSCSGGSCEGGSCDSSCDGGGCGSCDDSEGGGGSGCGSCDDSEGGGGSGCGSCDNSEGGSGCGSCDNSEGGSGCGSCDNSEGGGGCGSCGDGGGSSCGNGSGGSGNCAVTTTGSKRKRGSPWGAAIAWALLPLIVIRRLQRGERDR